MENRLSVLWYKTTEWGNFLVDFFNILQTCYISSTTESQLDYINTISVYFQIIVK